MGIYCGRGIRWLKGAKVMNLSMHKASDGPAILRAHAGERGAFTVVELLVVIAIIMLLVGMLLPAFSHAKAASYEKICGSNLRQMFLAVTMYGNEHDNAFPVEPTEHNPHPALVRALESHLTSIEGSLYCPEAERMEEYAQDPDLYLPVGGVDSIIHTSANLEAGNISYIYWSFLENKKSGSDTWRNPEYFIPRRLTASEAITVDASRELAAASPSERWVISDFFRRKAPFPHGRRHGKGVNTAFQDGHVDLVLGKPKLNFR